VIRRPPCGNATRAHGPHRYAQWSSDTELRGRCDGWTVAEAAVTVMLQKIRLAVSEREAGHPWGGEPPLQVEIGPAVGVALAQIVDPAYLPCEPGPVVTGGLTALFGVPLVASGDLPARAWRVIERPPPPIAQGEVEL
jgi:hypothetical protein